jgi:signal transduction histidine kinase
MIKPAIMQKMPLFALGCLTALLACGQPHHPDTRISKGDSTTLHYYEQKISRYQTASPDSAIYFADQGLKLARRLHYRLGEARMLDRLACINEQFGNLKLATRYQQAALQIFHSLRDLQDSRDATASLGILAARQGDYGKGERLIGQALDQYRQSKNTRGIISAYTKLGELNELGGHTTQALAFYTKAEQLNQSRPLSDEYFSLLGSIGKLHTKLGDHRKAATYYEKGISQSLAGQHLKTHIAFLNKAGKAYDRLGNKQQALAYHQSGLQKAQAGGLPEEEARSLMGIASVLKDQDAEQSILHLKNALGIARSIGQSQLTAEIYRSLSDLYRQQSRYTEALTALDEHHRLLDSLKNANEGHRIAVLQSSYELAESKLHVESLEMANEQRTAQRNIGLLAALAILLILFVLAFYFYRTRRLNKSLAASNEIKDKLFSIIGHDLRNPIGGITQLLAVMEAGDLTAEEHQQMVAEMRKQGDVTLEILNALLNWGEAQLKGVHIKPATFNAKASVEKNITALHQQAETKSITIADHTPADLTIYGDTNHFEFIIRNLLSNAIKFSPVAGTIEIAAGPHTDPSQVLFSVRDQGKGITNAQQELFLKANLDISYGTKGEKGTGIGLMLSKEFVKANQGRIWIESEEGKGTTFYFTFPASHQVPASYHW